MAEAVDAVEAEEAGEDVEEDEEEVNLNPSQSGHKTKKISVLVYITIYDR